MDKNRRLPRILIAIVALVVGLLIVWFVAVCCLPPQLIYRSEIRRTEEAIQEIERYKRQHGMYPAESQYWLATENMFYTLKDEEYVVGFSVGFDESYSYDSHSKKWSFEQHE